MDEYVNKENLIRHIDNRFGEISTPFVLREIKNFPNADVVEVVRCKDCKYWKQVTAERHACCMIGFEMDYDEYCSYGERKE